MFIIFMSQHACTVLLYMIYHPDYSYYCYYFQFSILPNNYSYYFHALLVLLLHFHILSFTILFPSCTVVGLVLMDLYYFLVFRSESRYRGLIVEHILVQLSFGEFSFFFSTCLIQIWWMILFMIQYFIYVLLSLRFVVYAYMCTVLLVIDSLSIHGRDYTLREYLLAIITYPYSVFWEAARDMILFVSERG